MDELQLQHYEGWEVQYSHDEQEVCLIPRDRISFDDLDMITKHFNEKGYSVWIRSDSRKGYNFSKQKKDLT